MPSLARGSRIGRCRDDGPGLSRRSLCTGRRLFRNSVERHQRYDDGQQQFQARCQTTSSTPFSASVLGPRLVHILVLLALDATTVPVRSGMNRLGKVPQKPKTDLTGEQLAACCTSLQADHIVGKNSRKSREHFPAVGTRCTRAFDRDLIRGRHYGQCRECRANKPNHGCTDQRCKVKILLANREPHRDGGPCFLLAVAMATPRKRIFRGW